MCFASAVRGFRFVPAVREPTNQKEMRAIDSEIRSECDFTNFQNETSTRTSVALRHLGPGRPPRCWARAGHGQARPLCAGLLGAALHGADQHGVREQELRHSRRGDATPRPVQREFGSCQRCSEYALGLIVSHSRSCSADTERQLLPRLQSHRPDGWSVIQRPERGVPSLLHGKEGVGSSDHRKTTGVLPIGVSLRVASSLVGVAIGRQRANRRTERKRSNGQGGEAC